MNVSFRTIVLVLCVYAVCGFAIGAHAHSQHTNRMQAQRAEHMRAASEPISLRIPSIGFDMAVKAGAYDMQSHTWTVSLDYPHFASVSVVPNVTGGTSVIYAHNTDDLFGNLDHISAGDTVTLTTAEGKTFMYMYEETVDIAPHDVSVFSESGDPRLVLITCTGKDDSLRKLVYFTLIQSI